MKRAIPHPVETCDCPMCRTVRSINYNEPIEVTWYQYQQIQTELSGIVATRTSGHLWWKKYWVKLWLMGFRPHLAAILSRGIRQEK